MTDYISYAPALRCRRQDRRGRDLAKKTIDGLVFMAVLYLIALSPTLSAQQQAEPKPLRFDFTAFMGYRTDMSFPVEPHVTGTNPRVVVDASPSYGVRSEWRPVKRTGRSTLGKARFLCPLGGHHAPAWPSTCDS